MDGLQDAFVLYDCLIKCTQNHDLSARVLDLPFGDYFAGVQAKCDSVISALDALDLDSGVSAMVVSKLRSLLGDFRNGVITPLARLMESPVQSGTLYRAVSESAIKCGRDLAIVTNNTLKDYAAAYNLLDSLEDLAVSDSLIELLAKDIGTIGNNYSMWLIEQGISQESKGCWQQATEAYEAAIPLLADEEDKSRARIRRDTCN
jgi:hypothetical protein